MEIRKKIWPEFFDGVESGKKKFELRLADFECKPGDTLILEEWDPKTKKYTGRKVSRKIVDIRKADLTRVYSLENIKKYGLYVIELG